MTRDLEAAQGLMEQARAMDAARAAPATDLRAQLKKVQEPIMQAVGSPLLPATVRVGLAELNSLLALMVNRIEQLERESQR